MDNMGDRLLIIIKAVWTSACPEKKSRPHNISEGYFIIKIKPFGRRLT